MVHGNSIEVYYGIAITEEEFNKIKKIVSLEYKDLFQKTLNGGSIKYVVSGKIKYLINDKTDNYMGRRDESRVFALKKHDTENMMKKCEIEDKIDYEKDIGSYIENFLVRNGGTPSVIKINDINDINGYCSIDELTIEMERSYSEIKELLELIKDYVDIVPNIYLYKYSY
jgi:hypothetical protein